VVIVDPSVKLESYTQDPERVIEKAARTCYRSEGRIGPGSDVALIRKLITSGHESTLEHASATFRIVCDRGVSHELVRHRLASYSQESTRYCDYANGDIVFVLPPELEDDQDVLYVLEVAERAYQKLRRNGTPPQIARAVLPTCLRTEIVMTANLREWKHIMHLRASPKAHPQMQVVANMILKHLKEIAPTVFENV
jgi:thymidylate synthase (FAD)